MAFGSLLIALVAVGFWVRGRFVQDEWRWSKHRIVRDVFADGDRFVRRSAWFATSGAGGLAVGSDTSWLNYGDNSNRLKPQEGAYLVHDTYGAEYPIYPADEKPEGIVQYTLGGFQFRSEDLPAEDGEPMVVDGQVVMVRPRVPMDRRGVLVVAPLWAVMAAFLVLPATWLVGHRRRRRTSHRRARGACLQCGYDLRSGGGHERCPECGTAPVRGESAVA